MVEKELTEEEILKTLKGYDITLEEYNILASADKEKYHIYLAYLMLPREIRETIKDETEQKIKELKESGKITDYVQEANIFLELFEKNIEEKKAKQVDTINKNNSSI